VITYPTQSVKETPRGVYVAVVSLDDNEVLTKGEPVFLNAEGALFLQGLIHHWYEGSPGIPPNSNATDVNTIASLIHTESLPPHTDSIYLVMLGRGADAPAAEQTIEGKRYKNFTLDRGPEEIEKIIAAVDAEIADRRSAVVCLVLDRDPTQRGQSAASAFIADLSEKTVSGASWPRTALTLDMSKTPKRTTKIDGKTTGMNWLITLGVIGIIVLSTAAVL
jgi:hypothetical protein